MKCLNCGCISEDFLCDDCKTKDVLDKIYIDIRSYRPETCMNPYLNEYVSGLEGKYAERAIIPEILKYFDFEITEYYYVQYFRMSRDNRYEEAAVSYLNKHSLNERRSQIVLYGLIDSYIPDDLVKAQKWCDIVAGKDDLAPDLYASAARYYGMIGEYDLSDKLINQALEKCRNSIGSYYLFYSSENMITRLEKQRDETNRYRTKKPYWPTTEDRRRIIAMFYDKRGIKHPRIEKKPEKVPESEFGPLKECFDTYLGDYCSFWCDETFSLSNAKCIYRIAAVKISKGKETEHFDSFVKPWDSGKAAKEQAAKQADVSIETIEDAEDVDIVMSKFFSFVGNDVLASTGALGNQARLISRAARYAGMKRIENEFYDILDFAADISPEFDFANNNREYLLKYFCLQDGNSALEKARMNVQLYELLAKMGK